MKRILQLLLIVLCVNFVGLRTAQAAPYADKPNEVVGEISVSSGTMVAAAMETAGYRAQSVVLDQLRDVFMKFGALIYLLCLLGAIITLAMMERYDSALWLILGPALFHFCIDSRVLASGAEWQSASAAQKNAVVQQVLGASSVQPRVSWAFHWYNDLISNVYSNLIRVISNDPSRTQKLFAARPQIVDGLLNAEIGNAGLLAFTQNIIVSCNAEMEAARIISQGERDINFQNTPEYRLASSKFKATWSVPNKNLPRDMPLIRQYISDLVSGPIGVKTLALAGKSAGAEAGADVTAGAGKEQNQDGAFYLTQCVTPLEPILNSPTESVLGQSFSCEQLWCLLGIGYHREAMRIYHKLENDYVPTADEQMLLDIRRDIIDKLSTPPNPSDDDLKLYKDQKQRQDAADEAARWKQIQVVNPDVSVIPVIISAHLLRKQLAANPMSQISGEMYDRAGFVARNKNFALEQMNTSDNQDTVTDYEADQYAASSRHETFTLAMTLPYVQGVFLYGLGLLFPFFAFFLIVPGKIDVFIGWFALWAWVKFWDVGWAVVMVVDDMLWSLMPHVSTYDPVKDPINGPMTVAQHAFDGDPSYTLAMYYVLLSAMITGVVWISAKFIGVSASFLSVFTDGIKRIAQSIGGSMETSRAFMQLARLDYMRENGLAKAVEKGLGKDADKGVKMLRKSAEDKSSSGTFWKWAAIGVGILAGVIVGIATGGVGLAILAGCGAAWATHAGGVEKSRLASTTMATYSEENARRHYFHAASTQRFRNLDAIRSGLSLRGEFWNTPDAPTASMGKVASYLHEVEAENTRINWRMGGGVAASVVLPIVGPAIVP